MVNVGVVDTLLQHGARVDMKMIVSTQLTEPPLTSGWYFTSTELYMIYVVFAH